MKRAWPRRHPIWSAVIATIGLLVVTSCAATNPPSITVGSATPAVTTAAVHCKAQPSSKRPRDHTTVKIRVHTVAYARVKATGPLALANSENTAGRANANGTRTVRFRVGDATPGTHIVITVHVTRAGSKGTCRASLRPRPAPAIAAAPAQPAPPPSSAPAQPASCYPISDEGTCYEPGEFCRESDEGMTGVAGDGEKIVCENNDGLRWEPV
jgi:hypothetical protein